MMKFIAGISVLQDRYDAFITDIWGVLHNGSTAYDGVIDCLGKLRDSGKKVLLLSNSGRRAKMVSSDLGGFGVMPELYSHLITSGELTHHTFSGTRDSRLQNLGTCYYLFGSERYGLTRGLGITKTDELSAAEFILTIGVEGNPSTTGIYEDRLRYFAQNGLTMVCANPDVTVNRNGVLGIGPGALAVYYEKLGGRVIYFGKPYEDIYNLSLDKLSGVAPRRILVIGDSMKTDIAGANRCGLDCLLVGTGVHWRELSTIPGDFHQLSALCQTVNSFPTMIAKGFIW
ncbi:MAG: TIGR01459 family HAD-type hydrolase [Desulfofustis sp.]|nr:TIGR01459 family HAD-type hydrolase [Desulfofustis sp.]